MSEITLKEHLAKIAGSRTKKKVRAAKANLAKARENRWSKKRGSK